LANPGEFNQTVSAEQPQRLEPLRKISSNLWLPVPSEPGTGCDRWRCGMSTTQQHNLPRHPSPLLGCETISRLREFILKRSGAVAEYEIQC
jgi:hypothetical protein